MFGLSHRIQIYVKKYSNLNSTPHENKTPTQNPLMFRRQSEKFYCSGKIENLSELQKFTRPMSLVWYEHLNEIYKYLRTFLLGRRRRPMSLVWSERSVSKDLFVVIIICCAPNFFLA